MIARSQNPKPVVIIPLPFGFFLANCTIPVIYRIVDIINIKSETKKVTVSIFQGSFPVV